MNFFKRIFDNDSTGIRNAPNDLQRIQSSSKTTANNNNNIKQYSSLTVNTSTKYDSDERINAIPYYYPSPSHGNNYNGEGERKGEEKMDKRDCRRAYNNGVANNNNNNNNNYYY